MSYPEKCAAMNGRVDKAELIAKLQSLQGLTDGERGELIRLLRTHKKYGLVWEDKPEEPMRERSMSSISIRLTTRATRISSTTTPSWTAKTPTATPNGSRL